MRTVCFVRRTVRSCAILASGFLLASTPMQSSEVDRHNQLTQEELQQGWRLLFDGRTAQRWRGFKSSRFPETGWVVEDGILKLKSGVGGGNIVTEDRFDNFDLRWDWMIFPRGNNGVKYFITEERSGSIGHEYQMLDDSPGGREKGKTAAFYDVLPARSDKPLNPPGQWNSSRILVQGNHVEHWLNGEKVLEYEMGSPEVLEAIANSKFKNVAGFGTNFKGHILLTDHGHETWFRNIKIRELSP